MSEVLRRGEMYPLGDGHPLDRPRGSLRAKWNGEKRPPKAGEWYLSGSVITAYRAGGDLSYPYHIATLVRAEQVTRWVDLGPVPSRFDDDIPDDGFITPIGARGPDDPRDEPLAATFGADLDDLTE